MSEIEKIRKRAKAHNAHADLMLPSVMTFVKDVGFLLKRIGELEAKNERLKSEIRKRDELLDRMA